MKTMEKMKSAAMETAVKTALAYLERDPGSEYSEDDEARRSGLS